MEASPAALEPAGTDRDALIARARGIATSTLFLGAVVFLLTWGGGLVAPRTVSIDDSFHAGLNMAIVNGLQFGSDVSVTYGPLGFLKSYLVFYEWPARAAIAYGLALHLALSVSLVWALRRNFGVVVSLVVAIVAAALARGDLSAIAIRDDAGVVILASIWALALIWPRPPGFVRPLLVYGGGVFAAIELLAKINTGLIVIAVIGLALLVAERDRLRSLLAFAGTLVATTAALWLITGQGLGDVGPFVSRSIEIVSGYSSGARLDWETRDYDYFLIPAILIASAALAWFATGGLRRSARLAALAIFAGVAFTAAKNGLVSHDPFHMATFFGTMLGLCIAFALPAGRRIRIAALALMAAIAGGAMTTASDEYPLVNPFENVANAADTVFTAIVPGQLSDEVERNRDELIAAHDVDARSLELLEGHTVHVEPSEASAAWAYELDWGPLPVYQPYIAWTPKLDEVNAEALASPDGPDRILRQNLNALGRFPAYESPAAMIEMLCNFRVLRSTNEWQVLGRVPDRCGEPRSLGTIEATYGQSVPIPKAEPDSIVFARVDGAEPAGLERLRALIDRPKGRQVTFATSDGGAASDLTGTPAYGEYVFLPATAGDGLIMSISEGDDLPDPFRLSPEADSVAFGLDHQGSDDPLEVEFFSMPLRPEPPPGEGTAAAG